MTDNDNDNDNKHAAPIAFAILVLLVALGGIIAHLIPKAIEAWSSQQTTTVTAPLQFEPSLVLTRYRMEKDVEQRRSMLARYIDVMEDGRVSRSEEEDWQLEREKIDAEEFTRKMLLPRDSNDASALESQKLSPPLGEWKPATHGQWQRSNTPTPGSPWRWYYRGCGNPDCALCKEAALKLGLPRPPNKE